MSDSDQRSEDMGTYQMLWDCKFCGTEKLLGLTHRFCPNCGAAQEPETRYFPSDEDKVTVEDHRYHGADVICPACGTANGGAANNCQQCGSPLESGEKASTMDEQRRAEAASFESSGSRDVAQERLQADLQQAEAQQAKKGGLPWPLIIFGVIFLGIIGFFVVNAFWTRPDTVEVVGHSWEREIEIEQLTAVEDDEWCDQMPDGAYSIERRSEQRDTRQVEDGEECEVVRKDNGDGTFSEERVCEPTYRDEPIMDNKCYFTINRWEVERSAEAAGVGLDEEPVWPELELAREGNCVGCEREGERIERYIVELQLSSNDETVTCPRPQDDWQALSVGTTWEVNVSMLTGQVNCASLEPPS